MNKKVNTIWNIRANFEIIVELLVSTMIERIESKMSIICTKSGGSQIIELNFSTRDSCVP